MDQDAFERGSLSSEFSVLPDCAAVDDMARDQPELAEAAGIRSFLSLLDEAPNYKVQFLNVCSSYPTTQDLTLYYSFKEDAFPLVTDRVALYKVGFQSLRNYLMYEWAPRSHVAAPPAEFVPENFSDKVYSVSFPREKLPRDNSETYQVCYMDDKQNVKGVSTSFTLVDFESPLDSVTQVNSTENDGVVFVHSNLLSLHSNGKMLKDTVDELNEDKQMLAVQVQLREMEIKDFELKRDSLEAQLRAHQCESQKLFEIKAEEISKKDKDIKELTTERNDLLEAVNLARDAHSAMYQKIEDKQQEVNECRAFAQQAYQEKIEAEKNERQYESELSDLREQHKILEQEIARITIERDAAAEKVVELTVLSESYRKQVQDIAKEQVIADGRCEAAVEDANKAESSRQSTQLQLDDTLKTLDQKDELITVLKKKIEGLEEELQISSDRSEVLNADNLELLKTNMKFVDDVKALRSKLEEAEREKDGSEKVAVHLRSCLEASNTKYDALLRSKTKMGERLNELRKCLVENQCAYLPRDLDSFNNYEIEGEFEPFEIPFSPSLSVVSTSTKTPASNAELAEHVDKRFDVIYQEVSELKRMLSSGRQLSNDLNKNDCTSGQEADCSQTLSTSTVGGETSMGSEQSEAKALNVELNAEPLDTLPQSGQRRVENVEQEPQLDASTENCTTEISSAEDTLDEEETESQEDNETVSHHSDEPSVLECTEDDVSSQAQDDSSDLTQTSRGEDESNEIYLDAAPQICTPSEPGNKKEQKPLENQVGSSVFNPVFTFGRTASVFLPQPKQQGAPHDFVNSQASGRSQAQWTPGLPPPLLPEVTVSARRAADLKNVNSIIQSFGNSWSMVSKTPTQAPSTSGANYAAAASHAASESRSQGLGWQRLLDYDSSASDDQPCSMSRRRPRPLPTRNGRARNLLHKLAPRHYREQRRRAKEWQNLASVIHSAESMNKQGASVFDSRPFDPNFIYELFDLGDEEENGRPLNEDSVSADHGVTAVSGTPSAPSNISPSDAEITTDSVPEAENAAEEGATALASPEKFLHCPMCPLKFGQNSVGLLQEHVDSHLEFICPVCSTAFQRSSDAEFKRHVDSHYAEENRREQRERTSGPWGSRLPSWPEVD